MNDITKVTFVCTANKFRSPVLHYTLQQMMPHIEVSSQGIAKSLPLHRSKSLKVSNCKHLKNWSDNITCATVKKQLLSHKQEHYTNNSDTIYIFVSDRHYRKYGNGAVNCYPISHFINKTAIDDPLVKSRNNEPMEYVYADILKVCENVKKCFDKMP